MKSEGSTPVIGVTEYAVDNTGRQDALIAAFRETVRGNPWSAGLMSLELFASLDGTKVLNYARWETAADLDAFLAGEQALRAAVIAGRVPDIRAKAGRRYTIDRCTPRAAGLAPGCAVFVNAEFENPSEETARKWIDTVFDAIEAEGSDLPPGGLSACFHISTDFRRVLNYSEWVSAEAHQQAIEGSERRGIGTHPTWDAVREFPGMKSGGYTRYRPVVRLTEGGQ